jgi:hypothetical protein
MTDSEITERVDSALQEIREAIEQGGGLLELDVKPECRWAGVARLPAGKLIINAHKTGRPPAPEGKRPVVEAIADLTLEGRLLARVLFYSGKTEIEFPGGAHKPLDHSGIARIFSSV